MPSCEPLLPAAVLATNVLWETYSRFAHWVNSFDRQSWFLVLCGALVIGGLCLRGFGSRSHY